MRFFLLSFSWLIGAWSLLAQAPQFDMLTVADGLATDVPTSVYRDSRDYVWIGTQSGLQRYDGYELRTYSQKEADSSAFRSGAIKAILEESNGDLWIGTAKGGLSRYVRQQDRIETFAPDSLYQGYFPFWGTNHLHRDRSGTIWVSCPEGLVRFESAHRPTFEVYRGSETDSSKLYPGRVKAWAQDSSGGIWVSVDRQGLCWLSPDQVTVSPEKATWQRFPFQRQQGTVPLYEAMTLLTRPNGELWVGMIRGVLRMAEGQHLAQILPAVWQESPFESYRYYSGDYFGATRQNSANIFDMALAPDESLWMMGGYGMGRWYPDADSVAWYTLEEMGVQSQGFNMLAEMYIDPRGLCWLSTVEGLARPADRDPAFEPWRLPEEADATLTRALCSDQQRQLWAGVENGGIWVFDSSGQPYQHIRLTADRAGLNYDFIMAIMEDHIGHIWVATFGGSYFELIPQRDASGRVISCKQRAFLPSNNRDVPGEYYAYSLLEDSQDRLWVGGFYAVSLHDRRTQRVTRFPCKVANCLMEDREGRIWVGTDEGLWWVDEDQIRLRRHAADSVRLHRYRIECLTEDSLGNFWIGTRQGLLYLDRHTDSLSYFGTESGLSHLKIRSLIWDQQGQLWVVSLTGLHRWTGTDFFLYRHEQGLFNDEFIDRSVSVSPDGRVFVGGNQGILAFRPSALRPLPPIPQVRLTTLRVFDQTLRPGDTAASGFVLLSPLDELPRLTLSHRERMISMGFAALGYRQTGLVSYEYQLTGFDESWQSQPANQRVATYTNLSPGDYTLRVRARDAFGQMAQREAVLPIHVAPPWWRSVWAYLGYGILVIGLISWLFWRRGQSLRRELAVQLRIEQAKAEEREQVRARSARDFHDEAGSYLTKLSLYTGLLRQQLQEHASTIDKLEENIRGLSTGMRDFIWALDSRRDSLRETLLRLREVGEQLFDSSEIQFRYSEVVPDAEALRLPMLVRRHLLLIAKEAMNNSLKYAQASEVQLTVRQAQDVLTVEIMDDGIGFSSDDLSHVNGLHNMQGRAEEMGATFSLEATPGVGTCIRVSWPIHPNG